ncbi:MAG: hypothetical protein R3B74_07595 [Nitrospirales bacterium]|nr:hypothetical protein [Nitrospirales bacterium]
MRNKGFFGQLMKCGISIVICLAFVGVTVVGLPSVSLAAEEESSEGNEAMLGFGSGLLTLVYLPAKTVYAILGSVVSGMTYAVTGGDWETAKSVFEPSVYGTYVITPDHLKGNEPVRFYGSSPYQDEPLMTEK